MKIWFIIGVLLAGWSQAEEKPPVVVTRPIDPKELVQVCGKNGCRSMPVAEVLREIQRARSGGGDVIGNGGGLAEQNFTYALTQLPDFISEAIKEGMVKGVDAEVLRKIGQQARLEAEKADKLIFVSGKNNRGIFDQDSEMETRLATTGLSPEAPIFVNLDLLYRKVDGEMEMLPLPIMVASLVHELGHNIGMTDHSYLDFLGARVRRMIEREYNRVARQLGQEHRAEMVSINLGGEALPRLSLMVNETLVPFEQEFHKVLTCRNGSVPRSVRMSNQHWEKPVDFDGHWVTPYRAWLVLTCVTTHNRLVQEERDFVMDLVIDVTGVESKIQLVQIAVEN